MMRVPGVVVAILGCAAATAFDAAQAQSPSQSFARANSATVGIAAGRTEGAPLRFAAELARVMDSDDMRVLPVVTRGPFENINDLLFLRGIDMAIVYGDVLEHYKKNPPRPDFERRISYVSHLFPSELHVFVRPEIKSLADLAGKPVNFNSKGTAAAFTGPIVMDRLGIKVDARFDPHPTAMAEMLKGDKYAATVWVSTKPIDAFRRRQWPEGFKFLPVPLNEKLEDYYVPAQIDATDYPGLVPAGQSVQTISVPALLAAFSWPRSNERYRRMSKFVDQFVAKLPELQKGGGFHPRWKDINLAANVPGWQRFAAVQEKLDAVVKPAAASVTASVKGSAAPPAVNPPGTTAKAAVVAAPAKTAAAKANGQSEAQARQALSKAGFDGVADLKRDGRGFWVGVALRKGERLRFAVDKVGNVYSRKVQ